MLELPKKPYQRLSPPFWSGEAHKAFLDRLRSGSWKDPRASRYLEASLARRLNVPPEWVLATSSCTAALGVAFNFLEEKFYEVQLPCGSYQREPDEMPRLRVCPLTYPATYCWAINFGWDIEWVDCDDHGWPVSTVDVGVDLWGRPFPGKAIVLDAAHNVLDPRHAEGLRAGLWKAVTYSFGPTKEISCIHGGALVMPALSDRDLREAALAWCHAGQGAPLNGGIRGYLDAPLCRAIGRQAAHHRRMKARRQKVLQHYEHWFGPQLLTRPGDASGHLAVVRLKTPGHVLAARRRLDKLRIDHSLHYPIPDVSCPNAKSLVESLLTLPCNVEMQKHDVLLVSRAVLTAV